MAGFDIAGTPGLEGLLSDNILYVFSRPDDPGRQVPLGPKGGETMLSWAFIFLVLAIVAAVLGFSVLADVFAWLAFILFALFLAIAVALFIAAKKVVSKMTD